MIRRPPRSTRTYTPFPTRRSSDLNAGVDTAAMLGKLEQFERADARQESLGGILGIEPRFHRPAVDREFRSEEHTSELQSLMRISYAVFCLKKKKEHKTHKKTIT